MKKNIKITTLALSSILIIGGAVSAHANTTTNYITEDKAKSIVLSHAGVNESDVSYFYSKLEMDSNKAEYDVEFWVGNKEYDYEVDAVSGQIKEFDFETEMITSPKNNPQYLGYGTNDNFFTSIGKLKLFFGNNSATQNNSAETNINTTIDNTFITAEEAKTIALSHANLSEGNVQFIHSEFGYDDGFAEYDVEFWHNNTEYDYEISATNGKILSYDYDAEYNYTPSTPETSKDDYITESKAKSIALSHAGLMESDVQYIYSEFGYDDGFAEYDVEFWHNNTEYDYEISATNGEVLSYDYDAEYNYTPSTPESSESDYITESKAKSIALSHAGLSESDVRKISCEFDYDDGFAEYEIDWEVGQKEYEYTINAVTGAILDFDVEYDD